MTSAFLIVSILVGIIGLPVLVFVIAWNASFKYPIVWLRKVGEGHVVLFDKGKVVRKDGKHFLMFKKVKTKTPNLPYKFWKFFSKSNSYVVSDQEWHDKKMNNRLAQGLILAQGSKDDIKPVDIIDNTILSVLDYDNRSFIIDEHRHTQQVMLTGKQKLLQTLAGAAVIVVSIIAFVLFLVFLTTNIQNICGTAASASPGVVNSVQEAVGG